MKKLLSGVVLCVMFFATGTISAQSPELYFKRGQDHLDARRYQEAVIAFSEAIKLDSGYVDAWFYRAQVYMGLGNFDRAIADFSQTLKLAPNEWYVIFLRGTCYGMKQNAQDADRAIADFTESIRLNPGNDDAYAVRGDLYGIYKKNWTQAKADFEQALKINPDNAVAKDRLKIMR